MLLLSSICIYIYLIIIYTHMTNFVSARFCEGGHICSLPRECCTQGCCPPYQSGTRQLPPNTDPISKLFFIGHWFFWCVVVAIILAILCAYSLWKKRRTLCGWGLSEHQARSEGGDSAGSCYAPPQYSRCNSFLHPPPPYTEVTSKPDLYPLVYSCNGDNGKTASSYLMVQYFRNYIVRPGGSLSAASTVDSLSSSFICNINEANTLVPPPYSRAASPEIGFSPLFQQQYMMPRSASQVVCHNVTNAAINTAQVYEVNGNNIVGRPYQNRNVVGNHMAASGVGCMSGMSEDRSITDTSNYNTNAEDAENGILYNENESMLEGPTKHGNANVINNNNKMRILPNSTGFVQSQSDQHFRYVANSNSSISDIFVNNSCAAGIGGGGENAISSYSRDTSVSESTSGVALHASNAGNESLQSQPGSMEASITNNKESIKFNKLQRASTNPNSIQFNVEPPREPIYQSNQSIGGTSITVPSGNKSELRDLQFLRRSLETCCQLLQQKQKLPTERNSNVQDSPLRMNDLTKNYIDDGLLRSYLTSATCSGVSSLVNIGTPGSPPQATSPTMEIKEILDQIRQLQEDVCKYEEDLFTHSSPNKLHQTLSSLSATMPPADGSLKMQRIATMPETHMFDEAGDNASHSISNISLANNDVCTTAASTTITATTSPSNAETQSNNLFPNKALNNSSAGASIGSNIFSSMKRPSSFQQNKKRFYLLKPPSKATNLIASANRCMLKSPVSSVVASNFFSSRGTRSRKSWISRSAPTTPATPIPPNYLGDDSPLLHYQEDQEGEQNAEVD